MLDASSQQNIVFESLQTRPDLRGAAIRLDATSFPPYLVNNRTADAFLFVAENLPDMVMFYCSEDTVFATAFCVPVNVADDSFFETGWEDALGVALAGGDANSLFVFSLSVAESARGLGLGGKLVEAVKQKAHELGYERIVTPVRPTAIKKYPDFTVDQYAHLVDRRSGFSVDSWVRTLQRHGAEVMGVGRDSHVIKTPDGDWPTVQQWEEWTNMRFATDGEYEIPGGCAKLKVHGGVGEYREDCVWASFRELI